jgi:penicillin-binding protein 1A
MLQDSPVTYPGGPASRRTRRRTTRRISGGRSRSAARLEHSRNVPAIKLMDALGPKQVIAYARRFGLTAPLRPTCPIALGPETKR